MELASLQSDSAFQVGGGSAFSVCVCVGVSPHPFWTSRSLDVPAGVTQEEGHTGFLIHLLSAVHVLIFLARRIQQFLPSLTGKSNIVYERFNRSPPVGHFISF